MSENRFHCVILGFVIGWVATINGMTENHAVSFEDLKKTGAQKSALKKRIVPLSDSIVPEPALEQFKLRIHPILKTHCIPCHGPDKSKARLRIDELNPDLTQGNDVDWWLEVQAVLSNGEMPPPEKSKLSGEDRGKVMEWLAGEIHTASIIRRASGAHSSFRRMTKYEYNYALQDLLGLPWNFARDLPPESRSEDGFKNSSENLHMSVAQLEIYRRIARKALKRATVDGPKPELVYWNASMEQIGSVEWNQHKAELEKIRKEFKNDPVEQKKKVDQFLLKSTKTPSRTYFKDLSKGTMIEHRWNYRGAKFAIEPSDARDDVVYSPDQVAIIPHGRRQKLVIELGEKIPDEGILRVRVLASRESTLNKNVPYMGLEFGWQASNEGRALIQVSQEDIKIEAPMDQPKWYQWDIVLGDIYPRNSVRKTSRLGITPSPSEHIRLVNHSASKADIIIHHVEVMGPIYDEWPPQSHQNIFLGRTGAQDELDSAREILNRFMPKACRRDISKEEIDRKLNLFQKVRPTSKSFEEAMVEVLATVLSSPQFLYLGHHTSATNDTLQPLSQENLASRLSIFLWCSIPDERLRSLASAGKLMDKNILKSEVNRMLADPRSKRFVLHFVEQWLNMELLEYVEFGNKVPAPTEKAMKQESIHFFQEVLAKNESILNFIHSDYTMLNEHLANHYGLSDVHGNEFRRVQLKLNHNRGGLLTHAGLLAMNSSGKDSNPLKRGIWMLENILNDPPPPPPPAVPEIDLADPEIAKMTLKERIENHRDHAACMSCHIKIDPWGIAFENYDAHGRWRDQIEGKPVDSTSLLFNNEPLEGIHGLKRFLLTHRQDQLVLALAHKLCVFALGRPLTFADYSLLEEIAANVRQKDDGLKTLLLEIATSKLFQSK